MSNLREQKACHSYSSDPRRPKRRPLPDMGESKQASTSVRRYQVHVMHEPVTDAPRRIPRRPSYRLPLPLWVIMGMALMLVLILSLGNVPMHVQNVTEQWSYGTPRTAHFDERVGHGDDITPSHFIATNLRREVIIIEFPGGDSSSALVYVGPQISGEDAEHTPVTLSFRDVSADQKPDMLIIVRSMVVCVFLNDVIKGTPQFRKAQAEEILDV